MKVVIPAEDNKQDAKVDSRFGRCKYFALVDIKTGQIQFTPNTAQESGSGINAANTIVKISPDALIVETVGPKAFKVLENAGIKIYHTTGEKNISEVLALFKNNSLPVLEMPNK